MTRTFSKRARGKWTRPVERRDDAKARAGVGTIASDERQDRAGVESIGAGQPPRFTAHLDRRAILEWNRHGRLRCKRAADRDRRDSGRFKEATYCNGADIATTDSEVDRISCDLIQSSRSAVTGSTRVARCAGTRHATTVTASNTTAAIDSVAASRAVTP